MMVRQQARHTIKVFRGLNDNISINDTYKELQYSNIFTISGWTTNIPLKLYGRIFLK
jgi:hypothetical protein